jgi:hypothetical protein
MLFVDALLNVSAEYERWAYRHGAGLGCALFFCSGLP